MSRKRDIDIIYSKKQFIQKIKRLINALEKNKKFKITIKGETIIVPLNAIVSVEHERENGFEEIEFQIKWKKE